jgi:hypothetical protein
MDPKPIKRKIKLKDHVGLLLDNDLTEAQEMWIDIIISVVTQPKFSMDIGNMDYVLGNMVAKYVSSSKYYRITESALSHLTAIGININEPVHIKNFVYGKDKKTILEHIIPASVIKHAIVSSQDTNEIKHILLNSGFVVIATRNEDDLLKAAKLANKMPTNWNGFGDAPDKRYQAVGIKLSKSMIEHIGPICR